MSQNPSDIYTEILPADIAAYRKGDAAAGGRIATALHQPLLAEVAHFLGPHHGDCDDVVQDAIMSTLKYITGRRNFEGDLIRLSVTIARNRCRDLHRWRSTKPETEISSMSDWLADGATSVLDELVTTERMALIQSALLSISQECRKLLNAIYMESVATEKVRQMFGLESVQGVYYRRNCCLKEIKNFLQNSLGKRSQGDKVGLARKTSDRKGKLQ